MTSTTDDLPVQEGYAAWASLYDDDGNPLTALEGPAMRGWFGAIAGKRVLDLGCGTGRHTEALIEAGAVVVAVDLTPEMMERARGRLGRDRAGWVRHALPSPLPFRDGTFELAVLGLVVEHVEGIERALEEVGRVLRPGGRCLASALHPERTAEGQRARFIDPATGERRSIATVHRTVEAYLEAGRLAGFRLVEERTLVVPAELAERLPRALPYVGRKLGWAACWEKPEVPDRGRGANDP